MEGERLYEHNELLRMTLPFRPPLIEGVITMGDKVMLFADAKVGKSIFAQQLALAVGGNHSFLGFPASPGEHRVLYVAGEGDIEEIQERSHEMERHFPQPKNRVFYWPMPMAPLNKKSGMELLMEFASTVKPQLTVFDPIYALMVGSMMADEPSGDFVRNMNFYQHVTGSAVLLLHHSHRPVRDKDGDKLDEGADSFFGSFIWKAYPRQFWMMRCDGPDNHYVEFMCAAQRSRKNRMGRLKMMMVEPSPLMFQPRMAGVGPTQAVILEELKLHPSTATSLVEVTQRTRSTVGAALTELVKGGIIIGDLAKPETFKRTTLELKPYKEREITSRPTLPSKAEPETK